MSTVRVRNRSADTSAGNSASIWYDCPFLEIAQNPGIGYGFTDDFDRGGLITSPTTEAALVGIPYSGFGSSGSTITQDSDLGGVITLTEATDNESVALKSQQHSFDISNVSGQLWFEARIKTSTITADEQNIFLGLMDTLPLIVGVPIKIDGTLEDTMNVVGFFKEEGNTTAFDSVYKANGVTVVEVQTDIGTLAVDTYVKLGMRVATEDGVQVLSYYINGVRQTGQKTIIDALGTTFPSDVRMAPCLVMLLENSSAETVAMDWWSCWQLRV